MGYLTNSVISVISVICAMPYALESEPNLIHSPGGPLAKSKVFTYALTRV